MIFYGVMLNIREISLQEAMNEKGISEINNPKLVIDLSKHRVFLYNGSSFVKSYKASFGRGGLNKKLGQTDYITPIGKYEICSIDTVHKFYKFLEMSYPNVNDATEALREGYITTEEFNYITNASKNDESIESKKNFFTKLGIHGIGEYNFIFKNLPFVFDWTNGSVAVSNENVDEILSVVSVGTTIEIKK